MKRELKGVIGEETPISYLTIARPIPMKRELKEVYDSGVFQFFVYRKAHPDEKGTERRPEYFIDTPAKQIARPIPMKRELKVQFRSLGSRSDYIARPIPMKRELKANDIDIWYFIFNPSQGPSR